MECYQTLGEDACVWIIKNILHFIRMHSKTAKRKKTFHVSIPFLFSKFYIIIILINFILYYCHYRIKLFWKLLLYTFVCTYVYIYLYTFIYSKLFMETNFVNESFICKKYCKKTRLCQYFFLTYFRNSLYY